MTVTDNLRKICAAARPSMEAALDAAEELSAIRDAATEQGLDWSQVKAVLKAQIQDQRDGGERVAKLVAKADNASTYAAMLGIMAEKQKTTPQSAVSREIEPAVIMAQPKSLPAVDGETWPVESTWTPGPSLEADVKTDNGGLEERNGASSPSIEAAPPGGLGGARLDGAAMPATGHSIPDDLSIPEFLLR